MAIKVGGVTVIDDGKNISNIAGGAITGIQSGGTAIGAGATTLNFWKWNEVLWRLVLRAGYTHAYSNAATITSDLDLSVNDTNYFMAGPINIASGVQISVGAGSTFRIV